MKRFRLGRIVAFVAILMLPANALAHGGHLGEFAGDSHWIGWATLGAAAALAALLGRKPKPEDDAEDTESATENEAESSTEEQSA